ENGGFGLAALVVKTTGAHRNEIGDRTVLHRAAIQCNARLALARGGGKQLVDLVTQALFCFVTLGRCCGFAHDVKGWNRDPGVFRDCVAWSTARQAAQRTPFGVVNRIIGKRRGAPVAHCECRSGCSGTKLATGKEMAKYASGVRVDDLSLVEM